MRKQLARFSFAVLALNVLALSLAGVSADAAPQRGPTKFYDQQGQFRGYAWCRKAGMDIVDCNYYNLAQCQSSGAGLFPAYCVANPFTAQGSADRRRSRHSSPAY